MTRAALALLGAALAVLTDCIGRDQLAPISEVRPICPAPESNAYFFPPGTFDYPDIKDDERRRNFDERRRNHDSKFLARMEEPSMSCGAVAADVSYRFTLLRSFGPATAIRIERTGNQGQLQAVQLSGPAGWVVGDITRRKSIVLTSVDWERIDRTMAATNFWKVPRTVERMGADGEQWIIEGRQTESYHVIDRWSPEPDATVRSIGNLFVELAGWPDLLRPLQ